MTVIEAKQKKFIGGRALKQKSGRKRSVWWGLSSKCRVQSQVKLKKNSISIRLNCCATCK